MLHTGTVIYPAGPVLLDRVRVHEVGYSLAAELPVLSIERSPDAAAPMVLAGWPAAGEPGLARAGEALRTRGTHQAARSRCSSGESGTQVSAGF